MANDRTSRPVHSRAVFVSEQPERPRERQRDKPPCQRPLAIMTMQMK
jgi:hypothetical protein